MRRIDALLSEYGESHQNPTNKMVHWICVPIIFWTVTAGLYALPAPALLGQAGWLSVAGVLALIYYLILSPRLTVGLLVIIAICYAVIRAAEGAGFVIWQLALVLFVLAWIGQFWGHKVEGKKPSFFKDIQFLLIGPAWLLSFLYKRAGLSY